MRIMKNIMLFAMPFLLSGCFSFSSVPDVRAWFISESEGVATNAKKDALFKVTRLGTIAVASPYEKSSIVVLRENGSLAYDAYNVYPSAPSSMVRQPLKRLLSDDGRFGVVVGQTSIASADAVVEATITKLALDCTEKGMRMAKVAVELNVIQVKGAKREVTATAVGEESASALSGNYSEAFSTAFSNASKEALNKLVIPRIEK